MQIKSESFRHGHRGYSLLITMVFLAVVLMVFASMMYWVSSGARVSQQNNQYTMSEAAAEAAAERALAQMMRDYLSQTLTNASYYASLQFGQTNCDGSPWPIQYVFSDINGNAGQISVLPGVVQSVLQPLGSEYANLQGYPWYWTNIATATPIGQPYAVSVTVTQILNFSSVPIFQYAIFYNLNLEIDPGAGMFVNGPVWSNAGLWGGTANLTFDSTVSAVGSAVTTSTDPFATGKSDANAPPHFNMAGQPTSGNTPLTMPIAGATNNNPTNVESILNIPPASFAMGTANAYTTNGLEYMANKADLIISNSATGVNTSNPSGTNIFVYYEDSSRSVILAPVAPDFYQLKKAAITGLYTNWVSPNTSDTNRCYTNVYYAGWTWLTNVAFYDYRESDTVQALQIDVGKFNIWMTNSILHGGTEYGGPNFNSLCNADKGHPIDGLWAYNSVPLNNTTLPAVRMCDGYQLYGSYGFTVVTPMPIYVYGNYNMQQSASLVSNGTNTQNTFPAALMGDAITILSGSWNDSYTSGASYSSRVASNTVVNAACLEGIVQSNPNISGNYSGGVENFLRYLESWSGYVNTYNGSIVVMFPSVYATNAWIAPGTYYEPPTRQWGFDYNFLQQAKLPPMTPQLKKTVRVSWNP
ncbi:MAG: hypothetical protein ABSH48_17985 [Verrucomicrobiota bacterium]|jgi:hypothetical protein